MSGFAIAELPLGGGVAGLCPLPATGAERAILLRWRPDLVVSLTPADEMAGLDAADLPDWLAARGIGWAGLPVADFGVPGAAAAADWRALSARLHGVLDKGGRVLAHCRGGCGRSGMVLMRLMVEAGEEPQAALARLRAVRPCAVETAAQHLWAGSGQGSNRRGDAAGQSNEGGNGQKLA